VSSDIPLAPQKAKSDPGGEGFHNSNSTFSFERVVDGASYRDCSTVILLPTPRDGKIHYKVSDSLKGLMAPMNQKNVPLRTIMLRGMEVADAYNNGIQMILDNPELSKWKFVLTWEHDNVAPPDGLLRLVADMYESPYAGIGGLYWTKGEAGMPMIYGDPLDPQMNFRPMPPMPETLQECRGIAMGFSLFDMQLFKDKRLGPPWFRTVQEYIPGVGARGGTQDLDFCQRAQELGYRFAVDTRVKVGHVQLEDTPTHPAGYVW
jgi:hypothetical protein